jgi:hypothetical protein
MLRHVPFRVSKYRLVQKLNSKMMTAELAAIDEVVADSQSVKSVDDGESILRSTTISRARRMMGISRKSKVDIEKVRRFSPELSDPIVMESDGGLEFRKDQNVSTTRSKLDQYQSMRHSPGYQDLTHSELRRVQELREKKRMLDRKIKWLKDNQLIDPAKKIVKEFERNRRDEYKKNSDEIVKGNEPLFPTQHFSNEFDPVMSKRIKQVEFSMERDTAISRMRSELRKEKLERSSVMNRSEPNIGSNIVDPMKRHLKRRNVRVSLLLQQYLEEILSCNSAQIIVDHLKGAAISIDRIDSPTTRGRHDVYVRVSSDHDRKWVQERLDIVAPKLRSQLAVRVNYGYTPELKFHVVDDVDKFSKRRLMGLAEQARVDMDKKFNNSYMKEMNWK